MHFVSFRETLYVHMYNFNLKVRFNYNLIVILIYKLVLEGLQI